MSNIEYVHIVVTTNNRYICESRDGLNRRITVVAEPTDTIEDIMGKLEGELDPFERELHHLREEQTAMKEREIELTQNVAELNAANKNAAKALAATYDNKTISSYIKWKDAIERGYLNPGEIIFYKGRLYTVISPTTTNDLMEPDKTPRVYLDISDYVKKSDLDKEKPMKDKKQK